MLKYNSLRKYLDKTNNASLSILKKYFKEKNSKVCLGFILDFINHEIVNLYDMDDSVKRRIFRAFKFLNNPKNYQQIEDFKSLEEKMSLLLENIYIVSLDGNKKINSFLNTVIKNVELLEKQFDFLNRAVSNESKTMLEFSTNIVFDIREISLCVELFKTYPSIINLKDNKGIYWADKIVDKYINVLTNNNSGYILNYYDAVINQLFSICKDEVDVSFKRRVMDRLIKVKLEYEGTRVATFLRRTIANISDTYIFDCFEDICNIYNIPLIEPEIKINPIVKEDYSKVTDKLIISIDSSQTKIRDDAFSVTELKNGNYLLEIYAANVSSYVLPGSLLDKRARSIGKTLWTAFGPIHMFPECFSKETLSLNAGEDKRTICYAFEFTKNLEFVNFEIRKTMIKPAYNLSFDDINKKLSKVDFQDQKLYKTLDLAMKFLQLNTYNNDNMKEYHLLKTIRRQILNTNNKNRDLQNDNHSNGEKLVNIFKLLVGNHVSQMINETGLPFIYRVNTTTALGNDIKDLKDKYLSGNNNELVLHIINSTLAKSYYSTENLGHKGLGLDSYSNVSISIRNYISLVCERLICKYLVDKHIGSDKDLTSLESYLHRLCEEINFRMQINEEYVYEAGRLKERILKKEPYSS